MPDHPHGAPADLDARLRRLEEEAAFASHDADALRDSILAFDRRLRDLADRLARLEGRLDDALASDPPAPSADDSPPAGPGQHDAPDPAP
ncbi:MAG: SlyX family protein [Planctomycetota bacterium]|nr:SlyX family protein [Planctomycetota bacterium]